MTVAIIGENNFKWNASTTGRFKKKLTKLVEKDGARTFLFTCEGNFDLLCWLIASKLRARFPDIKRVYARIKNEDEDPFKDANLMYDYAFLLDEVRKAGEFAESVRNEAMINMCDVLVTYFVTKDVRAPKIKGYTEAAVEHALENKKRVLNFYER